MARAQSDASYASETVARPMRPLHEQVKKLGQERGLWNKDIAAKMSIAMDKKIDPTFFSQKINRQNATTEEIEVIARILKVNPWTFDEYVRLMCSRMVEDSADCAELIRRLANAKASDRKAAFRAAFALLPAI